MITLALTAVGLALAIIFGLGWLVGRLLRRRWPRASAVICTYSRAAAYALMHAVDAMNGHKA
jgi:flagellar biogenesis protein FliO